MILVDTSIWIEHFRKKNAQLEEILNTRDVMCHPFIIGELACGSIKNRKEILSLMEALPTGYKASHDEILELIEKRKLMGKGLGFIDMHLIASAFLSDVLLWSLDKSLHKAAVELKIEYAY
ncbi:MAG: PIN domain-containing protein [Candidatus Omnitrophica bacterium]|nr:PIN domain-containing protein [Candidatus Omnitrophota bacterium]